MIARSHKEAFAIRRAARELISAKATHLLKRPLVNWLNSASRELLMPGAGETIDFSRPAGEPALSDPASVSWRIFKNPVSLFVGGVAAVILELAEPRVRTGVWEHTGFRRDPARRVRRTGLAAMVTVYGPKSAAEEMIANVRRMHATVRGYTPAGEPYSAEDPELLNWVHATAAFGFLEAYHAYVAPLNPADRNRYYREGRRGARLYGVTEAPASEVEAFAALGAMRGKLERSPIVFEFLELMRKSAILPPPLSLVQPLFVAAAVSLTPRWVRKALELPDSLCLRTRQEFLVKRAGFVADRILLQSSPAVQSCLRVGLPADYLYGGRSQSLRGSPLVLPEAGEV